MAKQERVQVSRGISEDFGQTYNWPEYAVKCPECGKMCANYGDVDTKDDDGDCHAPCIPCGERVWAEIADDELRLCAWETSIGH